MNRRQTGEKEGKQYSWRGDRRDVVGKASTQDSGFQGSGWAAMENEKCTTLTAITLGSKYFSYVQSPAPSHTQTLSNPFQNLTNKVRGKIFYKEVFLRLSVCVVYYCIFIIVLLSIIVSLWCRRWQYNRCKYNDFSAVFILGIWIHYISLKEQQTVLCTVKYWRICFNHWRVDFSIWFETYKRVVKVEDKCFIVAKLVTWPKSNRKFMERI